MAEATPLRPASPRPSTGSDEAAPSDAVSSTATTETDVTTATTEADATTETWDASGLDDLDISEVQELVAACTRCGLSSTRTQAVFADGNPEARVMVVGEAPGANEDRTGLPFVGAAGKLLDLMLAGVSLSRRDSVYICNVIKCRPPGNRNPEPGEIATCSPYLRRQIELVKPEVILAVGTFAGRLLTGRADSPLGALRGTVHDHEGVPLVVTYHPAALLRNSGWKRSTWEDLQLLRSVLDPA